MGKKYQQFCLLAFMSMVANLQYVKAQSADSRVCNCFASTVSPDFMLASKAVYGSIGVALKRNDELKPRELQPVKFVIPRLEAKQGCGSVYSIYITDEGNSTVHESEDSYNEFTYSFKECAKEYTVKLTAYSKSPAGGDGNCSRSITFRVKPQCNIASCNCGPDNVKASGDLNIDGKVSCLTPSARFRRYMIQYKIINKTDCILRIESIRILGSLLGSSAEPITAKLSSASFNMTFSTSLSSTPPSGSKVSAAVKYSLNGKKCTVTMDLPYEPCQ